MKLENKSTCWPFNIDKTENWAYYNNIFSKEELVYFAMFGEELASGSRHADNIAPCLFGGITVVKSSEPMDIIPLSSPDLYVSAVHPQVEVKTSDARQILKKNIQMKDAVKQWQFSFEKL